MAIAAIVVLIAAGLGAALAFGLRDEEPVVVAADPSDEVGLSLDAGSAETVEAVDVTAPPAPDTSRVDAAPTPIAIEPSGEEAHVCPDAYEVSTDGDECFLLGEPTFLAQDPTAEDEVIDATIEGDRALCPSGWAGPSAAKTCSRTVLTAQPDLVTCGSGVPASFAVPGSGAAGYASANLADSAGVDSCLLDRVRAFASQVPAEGSGDAASCPETHPHRLAMSDGMVCLLPGPAPTGLFATADPDAGAVIPDATERISSPGEVLRSVPVFDEPNGEPRMLEYEYLDGTRVPFALANPTWFGEPLVLRVLELDASGDWLRIHAPARPSQRSAWVRAESFGLGYTELRIEVDVGPNLLQVIDVDDAVILESEVVSGREDRPTPLEQVYVTQSIDGPSEAYGPRVLWLAVYSNAINIYSGGIPTQRIHGTNSPELIGERVSSGAIRVTNEQIERLDELVVPGTPVLLYDSRTGSTGRDAVVAIQPDRPAPTVPFDPTVLPLVPG